LPLGDANRHKELLKKKRRLAEQTVASLSIRQDADDRYWLSCRILKEALTRNAVKLQKNKTSIGLSLH
jgi:hypothetical protein